jgi:hypothetical protein
MRMLSHPSHYTSYNDEASGTTVLSDPSDFPALLRLESDTDFILNAKDISLSLVKLLAKLESISIALIDTDEDG